MSARRVGCGFLGFLLAVEKSFCRYQSFMERSPAASQSLEVLQFRTTEVGLSWTAGGSAVVRLPFIYPLPGAVECRIVFPLAAFSGAWCSCCNGPLQHARPKSSNFVGI